MAIGRQKKTPWISEKLGLAMIIASLSVIIVIIGLLFKQQKEVNKNQIRSQGVSITRILSEMPTDYMMQSGNLERVLEIIRLSQDRATFAYAVVINDSGEILAQNATPDLIIPSISAANGTQASQGERMVTLTDQEQQIIEYYAPLATTNDTRATIHLGYFQPGLGLDNEQLTFFATLSLPIFLLTPLFYFLIRREIRPLAKVNTEIENYLSSGHLNRIELNASGELSEFMQKIGSLVEHSQHQINGLESQLKHHSTSNKLLSYQRVRIENALQAVPDGLLILDEAGKITYANRKASAYLGTDDDTIKAQETKTWCQDPKIVTFLHQCVGRSGAAFTASSVIYSPRHDPAKKIKLTAYPLFSSKEDQSIKGTLVSLRDITQEHLERHSRDDFIAHVSHELKTPLSVMRLYTESLQGIDGQDKTFRVEAVNIMADEVERMTMLINNLLSITQMEMGVMSLERKRVRLHDLLQDAFSSVSRSAKEKHIKFNLNVPENLSPIDLDKDLMRVAVNNLITNAIKYNRNHGEVTLTAEENHDGVTINVRDSGIGISKDDQARVFEKFFRSDDEEASERGGQGLGLALARDIIQLHNGNIILNSVVGEGTEFIIELKKSKIKLERVG